MQEKSENLLKLLLLKYTIFAMKKLVLIDGHHFIFRAFYGIRELINSKWEHINAVYGFASMLFNIIMQEQPDFLAITFDKGKSFRHTADDTYKWTRKKQPDEFYSQLPRVFEMVDVMWIPAFSVPNYEADDVMWTMAKMFWKDDVQVSIMTWDRDLLQLIDSNITIACPQNGKKEYLYFDKEKTFEKYWLTPNQIVDMKWLAWDSADNIKWVWGIGPKTTENLLTEYKTLEWVYENLDKIKWKVQEKLINDKESAFMSKYLATIITDIDMKINLEDLKYWGISQDVVKFFDELESKSLKNKVQMFLKPDENQMTLV